jgi:hypothetical protein
MGSPATNLTVQAQGTTTPLAKGAPVTQLTLRAKGISSQRIDSVSQMPSGKTLTDSLIYGRGLGRWTPDQQYKAHFYSPARYSHPQLLPLQLCSVALIQTNLSLELIPPDANDPPDTTHIRSFLDMQNSLGKRDELTKKLSQLDIYLSSSTYLPASAKSFSFDPANLFNSIAWQTDYAQYTTVQGINLPMSTTETLGPTKIRTVGWSSVNIGISLDDSIFDTEAN